MNKIIAVILPIIISFSALESYPQSINTNTFIPNEQKVKVVDKVINEEDKYLVVDVKYPQISGSSNKDGEKKLNEKVEKWTIDWLDDIKMLTKEYYPNNLPSPNPPYEAKSVYEVKLKEKNMVSLYVDYYQYTGGAHGLTTRMPYTFNGRTGELLNLKDIFNEGYDYKTKINDEINKQISNDKEKYFEGENGFNGIKDNQNYYLEGGNLVIVFELYEIAPYVAGIIEFSIPMNTFNNGINYDKIR